MAVVNGLPARLRAPIQQLQTFMASSLWVWPTIGAVAAVLLAVLAVRAGEPAIPLLGALADGDAARATLTTVIAASTAAMSLLFTGTIVALQLATGQYSPRLLRDVLLDRRLRLSLGILVGTVAYGLTVVPQLGGEQVPTVAVAIGLVLGFAVVGAFILFLDRIVDLLRLETIMAGVVSRTLASLAATHPPDHDPADVELPSWASTVPARRDGYVQAVSLDALGEAAAAHGANVMLRPRVGDFLARDTAAAWVWRGHDEPIDDDDLDALAGAVDGALALGADRTMSGDPAYGIRHLVDIGLRGVSPGINDPTTAQQAIALTTQVLVPLAQRRLADRVTGDGEVVAAVRQPDLAAYLELAQSQLLHYGGGDARVVAELAHQLRDVLQGGTRPERIDLVRTHLERLRTDARQRDHAQHARALIAAAIGQVENLLDGVASEADDRAG